MGGGKRRGGEGEPMEGGGAFSAWGEEMNMVLKKCLKNDCLHIKAK